MLHYWAAFVLGSCFGAVIVAILQMAKREPPAIGPAPVEWICRACGQVTPAQTGTLRQLKLEVWDTYGRMIESWPVGEGENLSSRPVDAALLEAVRQVVATHNEKTRRLQVVK